MSKSKKDLSTKELLGIQSIDEFSLATRFGDLVFFKIAPTNISVLSESNVSSRIYALMTVLKGVTDIELMCLNSKENFDSNKMFLKQRLDNEHNSAIRKLLTLDSSYLDRMQISMATAREFLIIIRLKDEKETDVLPYLSRIEKSLNDQGFVSKRANSDDIKNLLGVYFEQNVTTDKFEDFDGQRWVLPY